MVKIHENLNSGEITLCFLLIVFADKGSNLFINKLEEYTYQKRNLQGFLRKKTFVKGFTYLSFPNVYLQTYQRIDKSVLVYLA